MIIEIMTLLMREREKERERKTQDYSDINTTLNFNEKEQFNDYLLNMLREWALRGVSKKKVDTLLTLLIPIFPFLPKCHKTLLRTSRKVNVVNKNDGLFWYKGIKLNIRQLLSNEYIRQYGEIAIDVNRWHSFKQKLRNAFLAYSWQISRF